MFEFPVVFVDIETTGGSYRNSRVLEVAAIRYENGEIMREFSSLVQPDAPVPATITTLTGIRNSDVADAPRFDDIADELQELFEGAVFIAHNVRFDYSFLRMEFERVGIAFQPKLLCTVRLSRALYQNVHGHSLEKLIARHAIAVADRHRAMADTRAILAFSQIAYSEKGKAAFDEAVNRQLKSQFLPPNIREEAIAQLPNTPGVYLFEDENHQPIYIGKSVSIRSRVLSHFRDQSSKELKISHSVHHIKVIETGSELAALILESKLIKQQKPLYNRMLRRVSSYAMLIRNDDGEYASIGLHSGKIDAESNLAIIYGLYETRTKAKKRIDEITRTFNLCPKLMGIEKTKGACFSYSLGKCKGACVGEESAEHYNRRFEIALERTKLSSWPYETAVAVPLGEEGQGVIIDNWIVQGFYSDNQTDALHQHENTFDVDEYKIVRRFLQQNSSAVLPIAPRQATLF